MNALERYDYLEKRFSPGMSRVQEVLSRKQFHLILNLERFRSVRTENEFSLILFEIGKEQKKDNFRQFIKVLHERMR